MIKDMTDRFLKFDDKFKTCKTEEEHQQLTTDWWNLVIETYNNEIAGDVELIDGTVITIPKLEI